jgi:hypothetical protein
MMMKRMVVATGLILLAGCNKEAEPVAEAPAPTVVKAPATQIAPPAVAPLMPVKDAATGIFLRASWTREGADLSLARPMEPIAMITLDQLPAQMACQASDFTGVGEYLEGMRKQARANGMADIGYHWAVDAVGRVWQLRLLNCEGEHSKGRNGGNIGILVLGDPDQPLTAAQRAATLKLIGVLCQKFPAIPLTGIVGHDEIVRAERPGADVKRMIGEIRHPVQGAGR